MYTVPRLPRGRQMWLRAQEAGAHHSPPVQAGSAESGERRPPRWVVGEPLLPPPALNFPGTKLQRHRSKSKEPQVRIYTCIHTANGAEAQGHGDLEGLCPTPSTLQRLGAEGARGGGRC